MKIRILYLMFGMAISATGFLWFGSSESAIEAAVSGSSNTLELKSVHSIKEANAIVFFAKTQGFEQIEIPQMFDQVCANAVLLVHPETNNRMAACQLSDSSVVVGFINGSLVSGVQPQSF